MPVNGFDDAKNKAPVYTKSEMDVPIGQLDVHIADQTIHVTAAEKTAWNAKVGLDPDTGRVSPANLPEELVYDDVIGEAGGIAELGSDARLPIGEAPLTGAWETESHSWGTFEASWSMPISYARAHVIINSRLLKLIADYDRARATLYGIKLDGTNWTFGDVTGTYSGTQTVTLTATSTGLTFTNSNPSSTTEPDAITVQIRQDA